MALLVAAVLVALAGATVAGVAVVRAVSPATSGHRAERASPAPATPDRAATGTTAATAPATTASTVPATRTTTLPPAAEPGGGLTLFPSHRLVAFYGAPDSPGLGVLGTAAPGPLWPRLAAAAAPFSSPGVTVVPSYELIAVVAQAAAGSGGAYAAQLPASVITSYQQVVAARRGMLILDIQPGRTNFLADAEALEPWLVEPDVGLALDPEWELAPGQLPLHQIGQTTAAEINQVSAWLDRLTVADHLPQKLLLIHQFRAAMVQDKAAVAPEPHLAIAFNMDGFGGSANKLSVYQLLATDPRWSLGYKVFYTRDLPVQAPSQVLALSPRPSIVEYE